MSALLPLTSYAEELKQGLKREQLNKLTIEFFYKDLKPINSFGFIRVGLDNNSEIIGLNQSELTDYAKRSFKNKFVDVKHDEKLDEA